MQKHWQQLRHGKLQASTAHGALGPGSGEAPPRRPLTQPKGEGERGTRGQRQPENRAPHLRARSPHQPNRRPARHQRRPHSSTSPTPIEPNPHPNKGTTPPKEDDPPTASPQPPPPGPDPPSARADRATSGTFKLTQRRCVICDAPASFTHLSSRNTPVFKEHTCVHISQHTCVHIVHS